MSRRGWIGSIVLILVVLGIATGLGVYKYTTILKAIAAGANHPEPMETVTVSTAVEREHRRSTTAIGTVLALQSITLKNEMAGTVREVKLNPGEIVEAGTVLVALDVTVEEAELKAQEAQLALANAVLARARRASATVSVPEEEVDRAKAQRDIALAQIARTKAVIERKVIRAPFKAKVGIADVHRGQYLTEGTQLTTLQGVDPALHVDFWVPQAVAFGTQPGDTVEVFAGVGTPIAAKVVAVDAKIDPGTRNAMVRARVDAAVGGPAPGAAVRVRVPVGETIAAVAVPVSALRKGPQGNHVFLVGPGPDGKPRAKSQSVEVGTVVGDEVLIVKGIKVGDQVATAGSFKLRDGVLVVVAEGK
jgi:membrane fusion protein (multidrug efflux system)